MSDSYIGIFCNFDRAKAGPESYRAAEKAWIWASSFDKLRMRGYQKLIIYLLIASLQNKTNFNPAYTFSAALAAVVRVRLLSNLQELGDELAKARLPRLDIGQRT